MGYRHRTYLQLKASATTAEKRKYYDNTEDPTAEQVRDHFTAFTSGILSIAVGANENISFGDVATVRGFRLILNHDADVSLNGGAALQARKFDANDTKAIEWHMDVLVPTSINVTNADATNVLTGEYQIWGDLT